MAKLGAWRARHPHCSHPEKQCTLLLQLQIAHWLESLYCLWPLALSCFVFILFLCVSCPELHWWCCSNQAMVLDWVKTDKAAGLHYHGVLLMKKLLRKLTVVKFFQLVLTLTSEYFIIWATYLSNSFSHQQFKIQIELAFETNKKIFTDTVCQHHQHHHRYECKLGVFP